VSAYNRLNVHSVLVRNCSTHGIRFKLFCFCSGLPGCTNLISFNLLCHFTGGRFLNNFYLESVSEYCLHNMFHATLFANTIPETVIPCFFQHYRILLLIAIVYIKEMLPLLFAVVYGTHEKYVLSYWPNQKTK